MREYDLKKALSTGSYTRNSIKPQLLVAEDGEYRQGDILDANATMEVVNSTASDIDDKINDILGVDNGAVQELVGILSDSDTTTGILNELAKKANISDLETVAGDIPQVPTNVSAFTNDAGYLTQHQDISGKANSSDLSTVATSGSYNDLSNKPNLANVATSGSYEDLSNKPHIPEDPVQSDWTEDDTTDQAYIKNKPNLATVATTGDYTDLSNKPTIPAALIQSDWAQNDNTLVDYIKNKPNIPAEQIQSDWNQSDTTAKDYIKNKPSNATQSQSGLMSSADKTKLDGIETGAQAHQSPTATEVKTALHTTTNTEKFLREDGNWVAIDTKTEERIVDNNYVNTHDYVEIDGIKWATTNVGASSVTDIGQYFMWGDPTPRQNKAYNIADHKLYNPAHTTQYNAYIKYNNEDQKGPLELIDDAAYINWGGKWRTPGVIEYNSLRNNTNQVWTDDYNGTGAAGVICTDKTDSSKVLFLPATVVNNNEGSTYYGLVTHQWYWINSNEGWNFQEGGAFIIGRDELLVERNGSDGHRLREYVLPVRAIWDDSITPTKLVKDAVQDLSTTIPTKLSDLINDSDYTQLPQDNFFEGHEYVDLGLPSGTLWAKCNVGASSEVGYGTYFKYGLNRFVASDATYTGTENPLSSSADAATIRWGNSWCSPTETQYRELVDNTTPEICKVNGVDGTKYTASNGKYIFFPHGGRGYTDTISYRNLLGAYWTSTPCSISGRELSEAVSFGTGTAAGGIGNSDRNYGYNIRPVISSSAQVTPVRFLREDGTWTNVVSETIRIINLTQSITDETTNISGTSNDGKRETVIYNNTSQNDYTVSISTAYKTVDGNQIILSVPAGCYGEVCYTNIGGTIFAKGIKQLANS